MSDTILSLKGITKYYPGVVALNGVSLDFEKGEVHAIIGENGAGKSTLIKAISGAVTPDGGEIIIDGKSFSHLDPHSAKENGIEAVYQEFNLISSLSVAENICFGDSKGFLADFQKMNETATAIFKQMDVDIDIRAKVSDLSTAQRQIVEIAKSVSRNAKILIMDEPSAPLSVKEVEKMFDIVRDLKKKGVTVIYISHRLEELFEISDRVSVLRDGEYITTTNTKDTNIKELIAYMVGRELTATFPKSSNKFGDVALEVKNITGNGVNDISLSVKEGEIVGLAGLVGAGRTELARAIFGADKIESGEIFVNGQKVKIKLPLDAIKHGIGLIPEDRKLHGCFLEMEIFWNITIASLKKLMKGKATIDKKIENDVAKEYSEKLDIRTPSLWQKVKNLSGGNQQKVVLAKTLATNSNIVIFDEPTRGIDVGAKQEIYQLMRELADEGKAILMISSEMNELLGMSDRIVILYGGRVVGRLNREEFNQNRVLELASGLN